MVIQLGSRDFIIFLLLIVGLVFITEANTSIQSNIIFGDEGFHGGLARWMAENLEYPKWFPLGYTEVYKTNYARPPLFNILEAGFLFIFFKSEIVLKLLSPLIAALIGLVFYLLLKRLYGKELGLIATLIFIGIPSFVTYTILVFDEILLVFYMIIFLFTFMIALKEDSKKYWILSAVFGGLAILTKQAGFTVLLFLPLAFLYLLIKEGKFIHHLKMYSAFLIIVLLVSGGFFLRNYAHYNTPLCYIPFGLAETGGCVIRNFEETKEFEVRSLAGGSEASLTSFGLVNYVNFAYGNEWFILIGLFGGFIIFLTRKDEKFRAIILIMLSLSAYALYVTFNRVEDTARQMLFWSSLLILISSHYWVELYRFIEKYQKYLALVVIVVILFFSYQNITSKLAVMKQVKQFSPLFFVACDWVKENLPKDVIIMTFWGHRASYACERTVSPGWADIRLGENPDDIVDVVKTHGITHLFIQKFSLSDQPSRESYSISFVRLLENNPDKFEKVYENGPPLDQCLSQGGCDGNILYKVIY